MKQLDKLITRVLIIAFLLLASCKKVRQHKSVSVNDVKENQINCFQKSDSLRIVEILKKFNSGYDSSNISNMFTENYIEEFERFPSGLFEDALNNEAIIDFSIESKSDECNTVAVYYNYTIKIVEGDEVYSSESALIFYFIKNVDGTILLDSYGAAG